MRILQPTKELHLPRFSKWNRAPYPEYLFRGSEFASVLLLDPIEKLVASVAPLPPSSDVVQVVAPAPQQEEG